MSVIDTTPRTYPKGKRPRVVIDGWEDQEVYLKRINSKTAYFCGPYYVGEMAVEVEKVREILDDAAPAAPASVLTLYAAVIEWPGDLADRAPGLVLARTPEERSEKIGAEIRATADAMSDSEWRDAITEADSEHWADWLDALEKTSYDSPIVTDYIEEVTL